MNVFDITDKILKEIKKFVQNGGDLNENSYGKNAIIIACQRGFVNIVYYIDIEHTSVKGFIEIVELLLRYNKEGKTALMFAAEYGQTDHLW